MVVFFDVEWDIIMLHDIYRTRENYSPVSLDQCRFFFFTRYLDPRSEFVPIGLRKVDYVREFRHLLEAVAFYSLYRDRNTPKVSLADKKEIRRLLSRYL